MTKKTTVRKKERRRMTRADAQLSMRLEGPVADGVMAPIVTESRNISGSGVYCLSPHYLAPLSKVALTIVLPGISGRNPSQRLLKCEGVVVRCQNTAGEARIRGYELACSFLGLEERSRALLDEFVLWRNLRAIRQTAARPRVRRATARTGGATRAPAARRTGTRKRRTVH